MRICRARDLRYLNLLELSESRSKLVPTVFNKPISRSYYSSPSTRCDDDKRLTARKSTFRKSAIREVRGLTNFNAPSVHQCSTGPNFQRGDAGCRAAGEQASVRDGISLKGGVSVRKEEGGGETDTALWRLPSLATVLLSR